MSSADFVNGLLRSASDNSRSPSTTACFEATLRMPATISREFSPSLYIRYADRAPTCGHRSPTNSQSGACSADIPKYLLPFQSSSPKPFISSTSALTKLTRSDRSTARGWTSNIPIRPEAKPAPTPWAPCTTHSHCACTIPFSPRHSVQTNHRTFRPPIDGGDFPVLTVHRTRHEPTNPTTDPHSTTRSPPHPAVLPPHP